MKCQIAAVIHRW